MRTRKVSAIAAAGLDVTGATYGNGKPLQVWECGGNWNQRFNVS
ncbi:hypothetical protein [Microbispora amethystogenes]|uniref:Ricin B lectin domain-containing protein n=1 Tax=Microbispora amethystogenes TaxID=1427754 RepID=A0ABQ4F837_9ACTN|nr:hypothetical protein [Microbispora amethystogenes]GIH30971.1 hypothetical protein Mam01_11350 [Microbispora amethystogenes]